MFALKERLKRSGGQFLIKKLSLFCVWCLMVAVFGSSLDAYGETLRFQRESWIQVQYFRDEPVGWTISTSGNPALRQWIKGESRIWRVATESSNGILELGESYSNRRVLLGGRFERVFVKAENLHMKVKSGVVIHVLEVNENVETFVLEIDETAIIHHLVGIKAGEEETHSSKKRRTSSKKASDTGGNQDEPDQEEPEEEQESEDQHEEAPGNGIEEENDKEKEDESSKEEEDQEGEEEEKEDHYEGSDEDNPGDEDENNGTEDEEPEVNTFQITVEPSAYGEARLKAEHQDIWEFQQGETVEISAIVGNESHPFAGWVRDDEPGELLKENPLTISMPDYNLSLEMRFAPYPFDSGTGMEDDPYLISRVDQLLLLSEGNYRLEEGANGEFEGFNHDLMRAHYRLTEDIDLAVIMEEEGWNPIGDVENPFTGSFNGDGHTIANLSIHRSGQDNVGFFGVIGEGALVERIDFRDSYVNGRSSVGTVAGINNGKIKRVRIFAEEAGDLDGAIHLDAGGRVGGLVGVNNESGEIRQSMTRINLSAGGTRNGLFVGTNKGKIHESFSDGAIQSTSGTRGGFAGYNDNGTIYNSYAISMLRKSTNLPQGGFLGGTSSGGQLINTYANSYSDESVYQDNRIHGLVGQIYGTDDEIQKVINSYFNEDFGGRVGNDIQRGIPKTQQELRRIETYTHSENEEENWDFDEIWVIDPNENNGLPSLRWMIDEKG